MPTWDFRKLETMRREKELAEGRDVTWQEIADATGVSLVTLFRYRQGHVTDPRINMVWALSKYFDVSIEFWQVYDAEAVAAQ